MPFEFEPFYRRLEGRSADDKQLLLISKLSRYRKVSEETESLGQSLVCQCLQRYFYLQG